MNLDISRYCDRRIECSCGHIHFCPIKDVVIENGALVKLPALLSSYHHILVVADDNTWAVCGEKVWQLLGEKTCGKHIFHRQGLLIPDEKAVQELLAILPADTDFVLGVGSGVINDICKYITFEKGLDYGIVGTAPSMDGFASSGAAMIMDGMKVTYTTHPPKYILADVDVVKNAPIDMIRSGYGDIIGKYSSLNDWKLSHLINDEYFCQEIYDLVMDVTDDIRDSVDAIVAREDAAIEHLTKALVLIGITLSLLRSTRPGSGSEHHLSHFFEIVGLVHDEPYFIHGTDVAYSTIVTADLREQVCSLDAPLFREEPAEAREAAWKRIYGPLYNEVKALQTEAGSYHKNRESIYREKWTEIIEILSACPSGDDFREMLRRAGFRLEEFEGLYGSAKISDAIYYGKDLKDRYSVLWLYYTLFSGAKCK